MFPLDFLEIQPLTIEFDELNHIKSHEIPIVDGWILLILLRSSGSETGQRKLRPQRRSTKSVFVVGCSANRKTVGISRPEMEEF